MSAVQKRGGLAVALILSLILPVYSQPIFWEDEIASALDSRDAFYHALGIDPAVFRKNPQTYSQQLSLAHDSTSVWYSLLRGCSLLSVSDVQAGMYLTKALQYTGKDPGLTWVLSVEFDRYGLPFWQEKCLKKLERLFITSGAQSAPVVAQPLLYKAIFSGVQQHSADIREMYGTWSERFDRHQIWSSLVSIWSEIPWNIPRFFSKCAELLNKMSDSWVLQLDAARWGYRWLFNIFMVFVLAVLTVIAIKYFSPSLHTAAEKMPAALSSRARLIIAVLLFLSLVSMGIIFLIWILLFLVWRHLSFRDKPLVIAALLVFLLYPLCIKLENMLNECLSPNGTLMIYKKVIDEGYYPKLDSLIHRHVLFHDRDYLAHTAAALYAIKKGDVASAFPHVRSAQLLFHDDPMVLVTAGNTLYFSEDLTGARNAYQQCIRLYPRYEPAYFNLGQYFFNSMETAKGMDYITQAAKINPDHINSFIKKNDDHFSNPAEWPMLRQLIQPDFKSSYFWSQLFPRYCGSWETANRQFGNAFFGLPVLVYFALSLIFFIILIALDTMKGSQITVKKVFTCRLCQASMCRQCKRGSICKRCFDATQHIRNENIRQRIMGKIQFRSRRFQSILAALFDMVFPGIGMMYASAPVLKSAFFLLLTSLVYGSYTTAAHPSFNYPSWVISDYLLMPFLVPLIAYNTFFFIHGLIRIAKEMKKQEE